MSLQSRLTALAQAVGADIKALNGKVQTAATQIDPWHTVGAAGEPGFGSVWVGQVAVQFRKSPFGKVQMRGLAKNSGGGFSFATGPAIFILPTTHRPKVDYFGKVTLYEPNGTTSECVCTVKASDGTVMLTGTIAGASTSGSANTLVRLDGIEFDTESVTELSVLITAAAQAAVPIDPWHTVGAAGEPIYQNAWGGSALRFRKDPFGRVWIQGATASTGVSGTVAFTLPNGYRPDRDAYYDSLGAGGNTFAYVYVAAATGLVTISYVTSAAPWIDVSFDTNTVTQMPTGPQGPKGDSGGVDVLTTLDWNTALIPGFYRSTNNFAAGNTINGPGDTLNPPRQAGIVSAHQAGVLVQRVWDLDYRVGYTRYRGSDGTWSAWSKELTNPPLWAELLAGGATPQDGDERYFQNATMKALGILWKFRYDATAPANKPKWLFSGGMSWFGNVDTAVAPAAGGVVQQSDLAFVLPLDGDYMLDHGAQMYTNAAPGYGNITQALRQMRSGAQILEGVFIDFWTAQAPSFGTVTSITPHLSRSSRFDGMRGGDQILPVAKATGATGLVNYRWLRVTPIRVMM